MKFIDLPVRNQQDFIRTMSVETDIPAQIIEKDWWVSAVMRAIFALPYADAMSFKGGTSLSKCWSLIERFSEDIDVAVSREFLGYGMIFVKIRYSATSPQTLSCQVPCGRHRHWRYARPEFWRKHVCRRNSDLHRSTDSRRPSCLRNRDSAQLPRQAWWGHILVQEEVRHEYRYCTQNQP